MSGIETSVGLQEPSVLDKTAIVLAARLVGDTWLLLIINELLDGTKRFGQIQEGLEKITAQTLSGRLKLLEHCGMLNRYSYNEIPPRVEYTLTEKGRAISGILQALSDFGLSYLMEEAAAIEEKACPSDDNSETSY